LAGVVPMEGDGVDAVMARGLADMVVGIYFITFQNAN
jgi:hypothetical protein